jgi:Domain of unknown function (DUF4389)
MSTAQGAEEEQPAQPVRLEGRRDADLSRWLWVVKWLLAIPHYVVLALLWLAVLVLTVVAFFAILFTGRYPRGIFDFNVGVLRWTWRVAFYSYGALGTDRYPPFTLDEVPDYPATLHVDYPERLSRGLALVKWWLLAIPQYVLIGIMVGSGPWWASRSDDWEGWGFAGGLLGLLVLFAGVSLVFTGRYPEGIFDFVLGLDRWVARVAVYVGLMTDRYPPFRLDQGGAEPGPSPVSAPPPEAPSPLEAPSSLEAPSPPPPRGGRIVLLVLGSIAAILAFGVLAGGCALVAVDQTQRDDDGFLMSPSEDFRSPTYAIVSEDANIDSGAGEWALDAFLGTVRIRSESDRPVFLGIAREADVAGYLDGVERDVVTDLESDGEPQYERAAGGAPAGPPAQETFWVARVSGSGERALDWEPEDGDWRVVLMNEDASRGVASELSIGAELDSVLWIGLLLLAVGALIATGAALAITAGIRRGRRAVSTQAPTG